MQPLTQPTIADRIYAHYAKRNAEQKPRAYLGGSAIGKECKRALWYDFRKAKLPEFPGRILRLFETGHREEDRMIADLQRAGLEVYGVNPGDGEQFEVSAFGGHFSGHFDGLVRGVPDAPSQWHLLETKTSSAKAYRRLAYPQCSECNRYNDPDATSCYNCDSEDLNPPKGVQEAKPVHYAQMQVYMGLAPKFWGEWPIDGKPPKAALYMVHCKDTDELYLERVHFDPQAFHELGLKAKAIIEAEAPPERIAFTEDYYKCGWCDFKDICHGTEIPRVDCRTCVHSTPDTNGRGWVCERHLGPNGEGSISEHAAMACPDHLYIPPLLENALGDVVDYDQLGSEDGRDCDWIEYEDGEGVRVRNVTVAVAHGEGSEGEKWLTSGEIYESNDDNQEGVA